jgi:hypothetical protein
MTNARCNYTATTGRLLAVGECDYSLPDNPSLFSQCGFRNKGRSAGRSPSALDKPLRKHIILRPAYSPS